MAPGQVRRHADPEATPVSQPSDRQRRTRPEHPFADDRTAARGRRLFAPEVLQPRPVPVDERPAERAIFPNLQNGLRHGPPGRIGLPVRLRRERHLYQLRPLGQPPQGLAGRRVASTRPTAARKICDRAK